MSVLTLGGAVVQLPLGRLSDHMDRRSSSSAFASASAAVGVVLYLFAGSGRTDLLILIGMFGIAALPFYGLSVAHANDRIPRESFVEASATLLMLNALAACFGPSIAAQVIDIWGSGALFLYTAAIHVAMAVFVVYRLTMREALIGETRDKFEMMPQQALPPRSNSTRAAIEREGSSVVRIDAGLAACRRWRFVRVPGIPFDPVFDGAVMRARLSGILLALFDGRGNAGALPSGAAAGRRRHQGIPRMPGHADQETR